MNKKIAFQIDNPKSLNLSTDTSYIFMKELVTRGYEVFFYEPKTLGYSNGSVFAKASRFNDLNFVDTNTDSYKSTCLNEFNAVFIRQNPPFDIAYITATYILDMLKKDGVRILNDSTSIRNHTEKFFALEFESFMPKTLLTTDYDEARDFFVANGEIVIKPLHSFGGEGVFYIPTDDRNLFSAFNLLQKSFGIAVPIICQQYVPEIRTVGDKRIILVNGEYFKALNRIQADNMSVSNTRNGAVALTCDINERETEIVRAVCDRLKELNLSFVGIDVIGGKYLTEINVTSPTGLALMNRIYNTKLEDKVISLLGF
jgi:glutathione synthase